MLETQGLYLSFSFKINSKLILYPIEILFKKLWNSFQNLFINYFKSFNFFHLSYWVFYWSFKIIPFYTKCTTIQRCAFLFCIRLTHTNKCFKKLAHCSFELLNLLSLIVTLSPCKWQGILFWQLPKPFAFASETVFLCSIRRVTLTAEVGWADIKSQVGTALSYWWYSTQFFSSLGRQGLAVIRRGPNSF